jgi:hypothetical protein
MLPSRPQLAGDPDKHPAEERQIQDNETDQKSEHREMSTLPRALTPSLGIFWPVSYGIF